MAKKPEQLVYEALKRAVDKWVQETKRPAHLVRIESSTGNGIPDCHLSVAGFNSIWIELKAGTKVRPEQQAWAIRETRAGGTVVVLQRVESKWQAHQLLEDGSAIQLIPGLNTPLNLILPLHAPSLCSLTRTKPPSKTSSLSKTRPCGTS